MFRGACLNLKLTLTLFISFANQQSIQLFPWDFESYLKGHFTKNPFSNLLSLSLKILVKQLNILPLSAIIFHNLQYSWRNLDRSCSHIRVYYVYQCDSNMKFIELWKPWCLNYENIVQIFSSNMFIQSKTGLLKA